MTHERERLLFIEPQQPPSERPVLDAITRSMCAAFRAASQSDYAYGGIHQCRCGAYSTCVDYVLPDGSLTNSLCVHYVAHHRAEVPAAALHRIGSFASAEVDPTDEELMGPAMMAAATRRIVDRYLDISIHRWCKWGLEVSSLCTALQSYVAEERTGAEELLEVMRYMRYAAGLLPAVLARLGLDPKVWGARALRVPGWDRGAWLLPMVETLKEASLDRSIRRSIAMQFYWFGRAGLAVPPELAEIARTADLDCRDAAKLAMERLAGGLRERTS